MFTWLLNCLFQITSLNVIGGVDVKDCVWRVMKHCFTNALAKQLNWRGVNGKTAFHKLQLKDIITGKCVTLHSHQSNEYIVFISKLNSKRSSTCTTHKPTHSCASPHTGSHPVRD